MVNIMLVNINVHDHKAIKKIGLSQKLLAKKLSAVQFLKTNWAEVCKFIYF